MKLEGDDEHMLTAGGWLGWWQDFMLLSYSQAMLYVNVCRSVIYPLHFYVLCNNDAWAFCLPEDKEEEQPSFSTVNSG